MNKKGQALVEFVIVLPVVILLTFSIIDFGRVIYAKNDLENVVTDATLLYKNGNSDVEVQNKINKEKEYEVKITISARDDYSVISVKRIINPITPGLNRITKEAFELEANRVIYND